MELKRGGVLPNLLFSLQNFLFVGADYYSWTLWYLNGLIFCLIMIYFLSKKLSPAQIAKVGAFFYICGLLLKTGKAHIDALPLLLRYVVKGYFLVFVTARNGLFYALAFVAIGMVIGQQIIDGRCVTNRRMVLSAIVLYAIKVPTEFIGEGYTGQLLDLPTFYALFAVIAQLAESRKTAPNGLSKVCRALSGNMYYVHMYFIAAIAIAMGDNYNGGVPSFVLVSVLSLMASTGMFAVQTLHARFS